jgi:predicted dehydrogenase
MGLHWGILGTARINRRLIPALRAARRSQVVAVASRTQARADAHAAEWGIPRAIAGYQRLLDDPAITAVYIPLPNTEHVPWTLAAIAAGKHVLCEKPMALEPSGVDRIAAAAAAQGVVVEEGFMYRHEPLTAKVLEVIGGGAIGAVRAVVAGFTFAQAAPADVRLNPGLGGGALWDVGCYPVSYANLLTGREPKIVSGSAHWHAGGVDDEFIGLLRYPGGVTATIYAGFRAAYRTWVEVLGSEGALTIPSPFKPSSLETLVIERGGRRDLIEVRGSEILFAREVADFEAAVLDGAATTVSLAESRRTAAALSALHASARDAAALYPQ